MNMELILTDVELGIETKDKDNNLFDVFYHKKNGIFVAVNPITKESYRYKLTKTIEEILYELSDEILRSRLSKVTKEDTVGIGDIFMYGAYVEQIK
jgi:hypothetical protein